MTAKEICINCRHWLGSRDPNWYRHHPEQTAVCHRHQPAEFGPNDCCSYFKEGVKR